MYMPGAITAVTNTTVNSSEKSQESSAPGWVSKKTTEAMNPTTATGTISRIRRRVASETVATTTAPDTAVEKDAEDVDDERDGQRIRASPAHQDHAHDAEQEVDRPQQSDLAAYVP